MDLSLLVEQLRNALTLGGIYALIAVGYTMVYGIIKLINFAHGEIYMVGAFSGILLIGVGVPLYLAFPASMAICALLGIALDRVAYKPLRRSSRSVGAHHGDRNVARTAKSGAADLGSG